MSKVLTVRDLEIGKRYRVVDIGDTCFGGCDEGSINLNNFVVYNIDDDDGDVKLDNVFFEGELSDWYVFSPYDTTTFELIGE